MEQINTTSILNPLTLKMLKKSTASNPVYLSELFQSFIDDANGLLHEMKGSSAENRFEDYYLAVHTLKGLCGTIGCTRMFEVLKSMDSFNKGNEFHKSVEFIPRLEDVLFETTRVIHIEIMPSQE